MSCPNERPMPVLTSRPHPRALLLLFLAACGGTTAAQPRSDAGAVADSGATPVDSASPPAPDAGAGDSATTPPSDSGAPVDANDAAVLPPGAVLPHGSQVLASSVVTLNGVTNDGYAIYTDTATNELHAVALAGGTPANLGTVGPNSTVSVVGPVAFLWNVIGKYAGVGPLSIWTSAHGAQALATRSYPFPVVSADGTRVLYLDNLVFTGSYPGDVYVVSTDGTGKTKLVPGAQLDAAFDMAFAGETAVVSSVTSASAAAPTLQAFAAPAWTATTLGTGGTAGGGSFTTNAAGTTVLMQATAGLEVFSLAGAPPVLIDPMGIAGLFTSDGASVVYTTAANALLRSPALASNPTMLVPAGFPMLTGLSPDDAWALGTVGGAAAGNPQLGSDLYAASATAESAAQTLSMTANMGLYTGTGGPLFTADASHVMFASDTTLTGLSTFHVALPTGAGARTFSGVWTFLPTSAGKLVFNDDYDPAGGVGSNGTADIEGLDDHGRRPRAARLAGRRQLLRDGRHEDPRLLVELPGREERGDLDAPAPLTR